MLMSPKMTMLEDQKYSEELWQGRDVENLAGVIPSIVCCPKSTV